MGRGTLKRTVGTKGRVMVGKTPLTGTSSAWLEAVAHSTKIGKGTPAVKAYK